MRKAEENKGTISYYYFSTKQPLSFTQEQMKARATELGIDVTEIFDEMSVTTPFGKFEAYAFYTRFLEEIDISSFRLVEPETFGVFQVQEKKRELGEKFYDPCILHCAFGDYECKRVIASQSPIFEDISAEEGSQQEQEQPIIIIDDNQKDNEFCVAEGVDHGLFIAYCSTPTYLAKEFYNFYPHENRPIVPLPKEKQKFYFNDISKCERCGGKNSDDWPTCYDCKRDIENTKKSANRIISNATKKDFVPENLLDYVHLIVKFFTDETNKDLEYIRQCRSEPSLLSELRDSTTKHPGNPFLIKGFAAAKQIYDFQQSAMMKNLHDLKQVTKWLSADFPNTVTDSNKKNAYAFLCAIRERLVYDVPMNLTQLSSVCDIKN